MMIIIRPAPVTPLVFIKCSQNPAQIRFKPHLHLSFDLNLLLSYILVNRPLFVHVYFRCGDLSVWPVARAGSRSNSAGAQSFRRHWYHRTNEQQTTDLQ